MERNLDHRVETCFPVEGKKLLTRVKKELEAYLTDNTHAWVLHSDGSYQRLQPTGNQNPRSVQAMLLERLGSPMLNTR
jgi:polyphosphate kinase